MIGSKLIFACYVFMFEIINFNGMVLRIPLRQYVRTKGQIGTHRNLLLIKQFVVLEPDFK